MKKATRAIVNLDAIRSNFDAIRAKVGPEVAICPAVKANAYGHGAVTVAKVCADAGAKMLAVALPAEAFELRDALPDARIVMFGGLLEEDVEELLRARIELTLSSRGQLEWIGQAARRAGVRPTVHVNVDTGMGRVGVAAHKSAELIAEVSRHADVELGSVYTHFPASDEADRSFAHEQIAIMKKTILPEARAAGAKIPLVHSANSGAILDLPESYMDMVRPGMMLYGCYPSPESSHSVAIAPALRLVSRLVLIREIPEGWTVSYGRTWTAPRRTRLGVVPAGYADGLSRRLSNAAQMHVRGRLAPVAGRVCMDLTMLDLNNVPDAQVGDEVVIYSDRRDDPNSVEHTAQLISTIPQEIVCAVSARVERAYTKKEPAP